MKLSVPLRCTALLLLLNSFILPLSAKQASGWQIRELPVKASLRSSAATAQSLWVAGSKNRVYISKNNGKTWSDISPPLTTEHDFRDIAVLNENTAIIMSAGEGSQSKLFITRDQGKSWQLLRENHHKQGFYDSIAFINEQTGFLLGDPVDGHFVIEHTRDQGKSWQRVNPEHLPAIQENEIAFAASGNTLLADKNKEIWFTTGGLSAFVYHSKDLGASWQKQPLPLYQKTKTAGPYALAFNSQNRLFALGGDYLQRDGVYQNIAALKQGEWQSLNSGQNGLRTAMRCIKNICLATGKLSTDISYDHGHSWQLFAKQGFYTLAGTSQSILAAGAEGKVAVFTPENFSHFEADN
ncbi:WD40/YVTN/BNR-like repeat-containing protein [Thalassomonas haliotis]|uniref:Oxidoreductase n=1 Tax=Thalassomonas haliotis TaxID=485448 RepID=A0ABY7VHI6_9GAMM|nr:YCF48-related protein [Thalassomonas haliotis]WDE12684.1 oxidoreductase [Thalassomonas haliotis]